MTRRGNGGPPRQQAPRNSAESSPLCYAIQHRDAAAVLRLMTQHRPTFTARDLKQVLRRYSDHPSARDQFLQEILAHPDAVRLSKTGTGLTSRYTTKPVLDAEQNILRTAARLAHAQQHSVSVSIRAFVLRRGAFASITREQAAAVRHATGAEGLALIDGQAGTGKTYIMRAVREIYQAQGYRIIGLAPTNAVARTMTEEGFAEARTLHSELGALDRGRTRWSRRTVVMIDEAAMIDSRNLARLTSYAQASGAKLILTGDDRQLSSIEPGGMFGFLKERFGAAQLTEVFRQRCDDDRQASKLMAQGKFQDALSSYAHNSNIHWTHSQDEALSALVQQWATDSAADTSQSRFVFAYTNKDVDRLNTALHQIREARGELGPSRRFMTKHGEASFATGDRVQFTATDKPRGLFNGEAGTIQAIDGPALTVALDGPAPRLVMFDTDTFNGFRHGYAGTIYKGQGRTIDQTYLFHSEHWRAAPSYVALTRHRDKTALFVARDTAADIHELTRQISRTDENRAASHFLQPQSSLPDHHTEPPVPTPKAPGFAAALTLQFREVVKHLTGAAPAPKPATRRRRRSGDTGGGFAALNTLPRLAGRVAAARLNTKTLLSRIAHETCRPATSTARHAGPNTRSTAGTPEAQSTMSEIIARLRRDGYSTDALRTMYPGYFCSSASLDHTPVWDALDWLHLWNWNNPVSMNGFNDDCHYAEQHHIYPHL